MSEGAAAGRPMRRKTVVESVLLALLAVACMGEGLRLILRKGAEPVSDVLGPGYYVLVVGCGLMVMAVMHARARDNQDAQGGTAASAAWLQLAGIVAVLALYILLIDALGYLLPSMLFFLLQFRLFGVKPWARAIVLSVVVSGLYYVVFMRLCEMNFPGGVLLQ